MNDESIKIIFFCIVLVLTGCKVKEKNILENKPVLSNEELERIIFRQRSEINTLKFSQIKFKAKINDKEYNLNGTIGIIRDSIIIISLIPAFGYEMVRIYCTGDNLIIIDRKHKNIYQGSIEEQLKKLNIKGDYDFIQEFIMNQAFLYDLYVEDLVYKRNTIKVGNYYYYTIEALKSNILITKQSIKIKADNIMNESLIVVDYLNKRDLEISYNNYKNIKESTFPQMIEIKMVDNKKKSNIEINIGKIEINGNINGGMNIPENYKQQMN